EGLRRQRFALLERPRGADRVNASQEAADPLERLGVAELGRAAAAARINGKAKTAERARSAGSDHRYLALGELAREGVLLFDLRVAPATRPVELGDHGGFFLQPHLVDAVLVAREREQPPVGSQPERRDRVEHHFRREGGIRVHWRIVFPWRRRKRCRPPWRFGTCISPSAICRCCAASRSTSRRTRWSRSSAAAARASRRSSS